MTGEKSEATTDRRRSPQFSNSYLDEVLVVVQLEAALEQPEFQVAGGGQQAARTPLHQRRERLRRRAR